MNQLNPTDPQDGFEPWHLTAYALGELDSEMRECVERRLASDPASAKQLDEIQQTLNLVQCELSNSTSSISLDESHRLGILDHMQQKPPTVAMPRRRFRIMVGMAVLATAASVFLLLRITGSLLQSEMEIAAVIPRGPDGLRGSWPEDGNVLSDAEVFEVESANPSGADGQFGSQGFDLPKLSQPAPIDNYAHNLPSEPARGMAPAGASPQSRAMGGMGGAQGLSAAPFESLTIESGRGGIPGSYGRGEAKGAAARAEYFQLGGEVDPLMGANDAGYTNDATVKSEMSLGEEVLSRSDFKESREHERLNVPRDRLPEELRANVPSWNRYRDSSGDRFQPIPESPFVETAQQPLSTFSIDVDTASYAKLRQYLLEQNTLPTPETIRIEEWLNYFDYAYPGPEGNEPFAAHLKLAICPWNTEHQLVRVAIQAKKVDLENRPASNLVFLIDVSGSMAAANKLPLVKRSLTLLASQLGENDRVAIVVYAGAAGCVLPSTLGSSKSVIMDAINELQSGGSTNGGQGIELAYRIAKENFIRGGINRVILCTDGDFNVGVTGTEQLVAMMKENARSNIFLTCLGYGIGNYNDAMMEQISNQGNGTYGMIDNELEARRMMVEQLSGTLMTVAKDVKIQVEFNPQKVGAYRLIGYENRRLATQDFADDRKDAGEIGAGHRVTALYEIVPVGKVSPASPEADLRYGRRSEPAAAKGDAVEDPELAREWMLLKIRAKKPDADESTLQEFVLTDRADESYAGEQLDLDWATSVAEFGLLLRRSALAPGTDWERMLARAQENAGSDPYRRECILMMQQARRLSGR